MLVHHYLQYYSRNNPLQPCIRQGEYLFTYRDVDRTSNQIANGLLAQRLQKGDRIAILGENSIYHCLLLLAASKVGLIAVPLNYRLAPIELAFIINDSSATTLILLDGQEEIYGLLKTSLDGNIRILAQGLGADLDLDAWIDCHCDSCPDANVAPTDPFLQIYTSGTTGKPKGVISSHFSVLSLCSMNETAVSYRSNVGSAVIACSPLFHIGGASAVIQGIYSGQQVLLHKTFDPVAVLDEIERHSVQSVFLVPSMILALLQVPGVEDRDLSNIRQITYGASPITESLLRRALELFQCDFVQKYGMTETTATAVSLSAADHRRALDTDPELLLSCGRPNVGAQAKIVDARGCEVERMEIGEVWIKSDTNMLGYHNLPDATLATLTDGWVRTGDAGYMDREGYIYLKDRLKDMVVSGGENIYPIEVEQVLSEHPAILEVAVIGVPDKKFGEALLAMVVLQSDADLELNQMISFCREKLAGFKIPRQMKLIDQLPRGPSGKVLKKDLRAPFWEESGRSIA